MTEHWFTSSAARGAPHRAPHSGFRTVLVVVPHAAAGTSLMDALSLLAADHRITTVFTVVPGANDGVVDFLRARGCVVMGWQAACRYEFDLVLAASPHRLAELGRRSILLSHDIDAVRSAGGAQVLAVAHADLDVPAASRRDRVVVGDICYDRLLASIPFRTRYRDALGVSRNQRLVVVTSTWHPEPAVSGRLALVARLVAELPADRFRVAVTVAPEAWGARGEWQIRTWLADCLDAGVLLIRPDEGWRAALIAANLVVGDYGPVTRYGAAIGLPTMVAAPPVAELPQDQATEHLRRHASPLREDRPLIDQVHAAIAEDRSWQDGLAAKMTSRPGTAGESLRRLMYRELGLREPVRAVSCPPVPLPSTVAGTGLWWKEVSRV